MKVKPTLALVLFISVLAALACTLTPAEPEVNDGLVETAVAATTAAGQTQTATTAPPVQEPTATSQPVPATATPTPEDYFAPDPLGPQYAGLIFDFGTCYDFDTFFPVPGGDLTTDVCLDANGTLTPHNGATMSGYATLTPPSKNHCVGERLSPELIAPNSDLYLCLQTNAGSYGFFVMRDFQYQQNRLVFDLYLFP